MHDTESLRARKLTWRRTLQSRRADLTVTERARANTAILQGVLALPGLAAARSVFCYISAGDEVDTHPLVGHLRQLGKTLVAPKILPGQPMIAVPFSDWADLAPGILGILAPRSSQPFADRVDIVITPGLGFTPAGGRLGYGKGYYDGWFATRPHGTRVALAYDCQVVEALPLTPADVPVHEIITEQRRITVAPAS